MGKEERAKVLKFERNAEFHYMKSQKQADDGKYIDSLVSLRSALKLEPDNREYALALAELYTEMDYFEESNDLYFSLLKDRAADYGEILFGMGCNFFGLRDVEKAKECFENYLSVYPSGEYVEDIRDFNEALAYDIMSTPERFPKRLTKRRTGQAPSGRGAVPGSHRGAHGHPKGVWRHTVCKKQSGAGLLLRVRL